MGAVCERADEWGYYDPVLESPAAYVVNLRKEMVMEQMYMRKQRVVVEKDPADMTVDELKAYYDRGGANRLQGMDEGDQQDMFRKYTVSLDNKYIYFSHNWVCVFRKTKRNCEKSSNVKKDLRR